MPAIRDECVFCQIVDGSAPAEIVYSDATVVAFLDIDPAAEGHTLVVPRNHARTLLDIDPGEAAAVMSAAVHVAGQLQESLKPDGFTLFQANEAAGWQEVFHFHLHVVPRWTGDRLRRPWGGYD